MPITPTSKGDTFHERRSKENLEKAVGYNEQAIKLDPGYAPAWAGLAQVRSRQADCAYLPVDEGYRKAREAAEQGGADHLTAFLPEIPPARQ